MAVPMCCHHKVLSTWKTLFDVITRRRVSTINYEGKLGGDVFEGGYQVDNCMYVNIWFDVGVYCRSVCSKKAVIWCESSQVGS
jgi:hypothetical protein